MKMSKSKNPVGSDMLVARWMLIIRPAVITATLGVAILMLPEAKIDVTPIAVVVGGTYILTLLYWLTLHFSGVYTTFLATQIAFDIFIVTVIIHYTGSHESSFVGFYFLPIMCASLFFGRLATVLFSTQSAAFYIFYLFVLVPRIESGAIPQVVMENVGFQAFLYSILMYAVGFFSSYSAEKLRVKDTSLSNALRLLKDAKLDTIDILQSMTNGLITINMAGRIMYINSVAEKILQIDRSVIVGKKYDTVFVSRTEQLAKIFNQQLVDIPNVSEKEIEIFNKDGSAIPIGLTSMSLFDIDGSRRGVLVNFKDLTAKKKLLEMIRQSERMAAIGELSAAIAHEIRNPLASLSNAAEILSGSFEKKDPHISRLLEVMEKESNRLQRISSDFLRFARMQTPDIKSLNLKNAVEDVLILIDNDPRKTNDIIIKNNIDADTMVLFDIDHLRQLMINIIINSLQALEGNGRIEIGIEGNQKASNKYIRLVFSDNGPGFPKETLGHMFEPFFSTKEDGTGLGLSLVSKIAFSNHGRVFARNRIEGGTEVTLDLPGSGDE